MTTIKEYKAMKEGATDALNAEKAYIYFHTIKEWEILKASRNISPELIRVIELAEDALKSCSDDTYEQYYDNEKVVEALSEIRKLKGE